ncbi:MAG TPA: phosphate ABC transporter ATP-binding protein [Polyangiaceae bacterium]|nr:phosphate ABC transporter ATP-binding protein [Polyangiaceae bacterium]
MSAGAKLDVQGLSVGYAGRSAVRDLSLSIPAGAIYAVIGPAGSGKTSLLRTMNLLSVEVDQASVAGKIMLDGKDVLAPDVDRALLRRRVGLVLATPQPLPGSIYQNLTFGPRLAGQTRRETLDALVEGALRSADLWKEVKDRLHTPATTLSGGQQQRLCIARAIALSPEVILLDEPCSGLDPISTAKIEEMMRALQTRFTWVIVTNNTKQAARVSDRTAFMLSGILVEDGPTNRIFTAPTDPRTVDYVEGRFG